MRSILLLTLFASSAFAADVIPAPADKAKQESEPRPVKTAEPIRETFVGGKRALREEEKVGSYQQPAWSARRRFPNTRIYVVPEGTAQFEMWVRTEHPLNDLANSRYRTQYELAFGLGHRLQLDLYVETDQRGNSEFTIAREKIELRYALANWGVIPGNPTLYAELAREEASKLPTGEFKLLLGGEVSRGLHWGANLVFEREMGGAVQAQEYAVTGGLSYTLIDEKLHVGGELRLMTDDVRGARLSFEENAILVGPSVLYRPHPAAQFALVVLAGIEVGSRPVTARLEPTLVFGWTF
jgi:hypothetical protein